MHHSARHSAILNTLALHGTATVSALAAQLGVSDETIRRDFRTMEERGLLERVHGGAVLRHLFREADFQRRLNRNAKAKRAIARAAAAQIRNGESLIMDTGSTTAYVAEALAGHRDLMVVTNSMDIARTLAKQQTNKVYLSGGEVRADDGAGLGVQALRFVAQFRVRTAIISIAAIHLDDGFMDFHLAEAEFSQAALRQASHRIVVADRTKFDAVAPVRVCDLREIDVLVTDGQPPALFRKRFTQSGVSVVVAR